MPTATKPPYQTGVYPQPALEALLSDELLPSLWPDHALGNMTIERARFSPGKDLAMLCALTLRTGDGDRDQRVLVTFAPEKRLEKAAHRYRKKRKKLGRNGDGLHRSSFGEHMFEVFPADWRLPMLSHVIDTDSVRRHVAPLVLGTPNVDAARVEITELRYRPHTRFVVHYTFTDSSNGVRREAIGKTYGRREKAERAWQLLTSMYAQAKLPVTPRPIGFIDEWRLTLMEKVEGSPMFPVLANGTSDEQRRVTKLAAKALVTLHGLSIEEKPTRSLRRELKDLRKYAKEFEELAPAIAERAGTFCTQLERAATRLGEPLACGPVHGAFKPSQLLVGDESATIVDLDGFAVGEPAIDVGNYLAKLYKESLEPVQSHLRDLRQPFLEDYVDASDKSGVEARALMHEAAALGRLAFRELHTTRRSNDDASPSAQMFDEGLACLERC